MTELELLRLTRKDVYEDEWMLDPDKETVLFCLDCAINEAMKRSVCVLEADEERMLEEGGYYKWPATREEKTWIEFC